MENETLDNELNLSDPQPVEYATFWDRVKASFIDGLILLLPVGGLMLYGLYTKNMSMVLLSPILGISYKVYMEGQYGATYGKMAANIKMINNQGTQISMHESLKKNMVYVVAHTISFLSMLSLFKMEAFTESSLQETLELMSTTPLSGYSTIWSYVQLISCMAVIFNKTTGQTLHDMIAETFCVKTTVELLQKI